MNLGVIFLNSQEKYRLQLRPASQNDNSDVCRATSAPGSDAW